VARLKADMKKFGPFSTDRLPNTFAPGRTSCAQPKTAARPMGIAIEHCREISPGFAARYNAAGTHSGRMTQRARSDGWVRASKGQPALT